MLAWMHRPITFGHVALVATLSFAVLACTAAAPSPPPATARPTPTPAPSVDVGAQVVKATVAAFATDPLVLRVAQTAKLTWTLSGKSWKGSDSMTLDLSDRDLSAHFETKEKGKTTNLDLVVVGKTVYARDGDKKWASGPRSSAEQNIADVIRALPSIREPAHLAYVGLETVDKVKLHHLTAVRKFSYQMSIGQTASYDTFDIWVQEDGTPVLAKGTVSAIGPYGVEIKGTNEIHFSEFGGPIEIAAPKT